jgi:hypothetical protein
MYILFRVILIGLFAYFLHYWWDSKLELIDMFAASSLLLACINEYYYKKHKE